MFLEKSSQPLTLRACQYCGIGKAHKASLGSLQRSRDAPAGEGPCVLVLVTGLSHVCTDNPKGMWEGLAGGKRLGSCRERHKKITEENMMEVRFFI